ncbi:MAG: hypothetical protein E7630_03195 [Ruminococcaceae bacterium]|nr:hypothetical protein [Oscillospiraceae bacterium]
MKLTDNLSRLLTRDGKTRTGDGILPCEMISAEERAAIKRSFDLYRGRAPWLTASEKGLALASGIASELARLTVVEFSADFADDRAGQRLEEILSGLFPRLRTYVEYACATGGIVFKPFYDGKQLGVEAVLPFDFLPLAADGAGQITACAFLSRKKRDGRYYTRVEEHRPIEGGYRITNRAFVSDLGFDRGQACSLSCMKEWAGLSPVVEIGGLKKPLFSYFGIPQGNLSHPDSPLGAPVFRRAEELIRQADLQFGRLLWEFEGGELAVDASEEAFRSDKQGKPRLPVGKERLYRTNVLDACSSDEELLKTFSPALRDKSLINGLNRIIMFVEDACGIARGTFSDPSEIARTATEVRAMRQRTYSTVCSIQSALNGALLRLGEAVNALAMLYGLWEKPAAMSLYFGDGVLTDPESDRAAEREDVSCGILSAEEFKSRWYGSSMKGERHEA